jgi:hypothetical protein
MQPQPLKITYIGGPNRLLEFGGVRLLADLTFDPGGSDYTTGPVSLQKLNGPAIQADAIAPADYVPPATTSILTTWTTANGQ